MNGQRIDWQRLVTLLEMTVLTETDIQRLIDITHQTLTLETRRQRPDLIAQWRVSLMQLYDEESSARSARIIRGLLAIVDSEPLPDGVTHPGVRQLHREMVVDAYDDDHRFYQQLIEQVIAVRTERPDEREAFAAELHDMLHAAIQPGRNNLHEVTFYLALLNVVHDTSLGLPADHPLVPLFEEILARIADATP